jgi:predicted N-acyltransferase
MADGGDTSQFVARTSNSIFEFHARDWDRLANPADKPFNPFVSHAFLAALERSGSATAETGWAPCHLALEESGRLVAVAPVYLKSHSFGEYVFDHHWAQAYERAGGRYYPKLLCASPFTPVPGPRLLGATPEAKAALAGGLVGLCRRLGASSAHVNFLSPEDAEALDAAGYLKRTGVQYHWFNRGYRSYQDFLATLSSRKRKALKRERGAAADGLTIACLTGDEIKDRHWDAFWRFYLDTGGRKWGRPYLTRAFFDEISASMADRIMMVFADDGGRPIAGALNLIGGDALYGRYWGRTEERAFLHFEVCYHQAIDYAIERGISRVEAGAQGEHKIARGYEPVLTHSAHWIADPRLKTGLEGYLARERDEIDQEAEALGDYTPYRRDGRDSSQN